MDTNDQNFLMPIRKLNEHGYPGCTAKHYQAIAAGTLIATKMGSRTFISKKNADAWVNGLPKMGGKAGDAVLQMAQQRLEDLGKAVREGLLHRAVVVAHLADVARKTGLVLDHAA